MFREGNGSLVILLNKRVARRLSQIDFHCWCDHNHHSLPFCTSWNDIDLYFRSLRHEKVKIFALIFSQIFSSTVDQDEISYAVGECRSDGPQIRLILFSYA